MYSATANRPFARLSLPDPAIEMSRWLEVPDAIDEPGDWRCVVRLADGTEVIGEEDAIEIGASVSPQQNGRSRKIQERPFGRSMRPVRRGFYL